MMNAIKLIATQEGVTAVLANDSHASRWTEQHKTLRYDGTLDKVLPLIKPGDYVVDCGAHIGGWTVPFLNAVGSAGLVYAFEPMPLTFACLAVNTRDYQNVRLFNHALSDTTDLVAMQADDNAGASHIAKYDAGDVALVRAFSRKLDQLCLPRVDFMKIDVEGHERRLLVGAIETIKRCRPKIICEINHGALAAQGTSAETVIALMESFGYRMEFLHESHNLTFTMLDVFFFPK